jgi:hypothetical protein
MQAFTYHTRPGETFPRQPERRAVAELAWAVALPDYHENFGLVILCGFQTRFGNRWGKQWNRSTVNRSRRLSMARAVDSLLARGLLCHAVPPTWALHYYATSGEVVGWGKQDPSRTIWAGFEWATVRDTADPDFREFWKYEGDSWPAYWLTPAGHEAAAGVVCEYDAKALVEQYHDSRRVQINVAGRRHAWWAYANEMAGAGA